MISLNVYLTPNAGKAEELESAIRDRWVKAMVEQPGFLSAAMVKPYSDDELAALEATKPQSAYEVVSYWNTEAERVARFFATLMEVFLFISAKRLFTTMIHVQTLYKARDDIFKQMQAAVTSPQEKEELEQLKSMF